MAASHHIGHTCGAPGCTRHIKYYFCCGQHRALLGFELSADLQTAWRERRFDAERFAAVRARTLEAWGWQAEKRVAADKL